MNKKAQLGVGGILMLFIGIVVCLVIIQQIFNSQAVMTTKTVVTDETINIASARLVGGQINPNTTFTIVNAPSGWKTEKCPISSVTFGNATADYTLDTDYTFTASTGVLKLINTAKVNGTTGSNPNTTLIDYTWCPDGYNVDGSSRSIAALIGLLSVLGLFVWVISTGRFDDWFG